MNLFKTREMSVFYELYSGRVNVLINLLASPKKTAPILAIHLP